MVQLMPVHPNPHHLLPHLNPDVVLSVWYQLTQVVLEKKPLWVSYYLNTALMVTNTTDTFRDSAAVGSNR